MKKFRPGDYSGLVDYWLRMFPNEPPAMCGAAKLMNGGKSSRLTCTYTSLTSYSTVVARRFTNSYYESLIVYSSSYYSVTTAKQLRNLEYEKATSDSNIITSNTIDDISDKRVSADIIDRFLYLMLHYAGRYKRARKEHTKNYAKREFEQQKKDAMKFIHFIRADRRTNKWDSVLVKTFDIDMDEKYIEEKIKYHNQKEERKIASDRLISKADMVWIDENKVVSESGVSVDVMSFKIATGAINSSENIVSAIANEINFKGIVTKRKTEYYKVNNTIISKDKMDALISTHASEAL